MTQDVFAAADRTCPAAVAYDLMRDILLDDPSRPSPSTPEFRSYLLDLYAECLLAVRGKRVASQRTGVRGVASPSRERERREASTVAKPMKPNQSTLAS